MKKLTSLILLALCLCCAVPLQAADLLIVQSVRDSSFSEVLKGFSSVCRASSKTIVLSDYVDVDMARIIREEQPALIVTLGETALSSVRKVRRTPILSLMSLGLSMGRNPAPNVTGVGMVAAPEQYMRLFNSMRVKRVGVLYNPARSGVYLSRARRAAERSGVDLVVREVRDPLDTPKLLAEFKGRVDALWLLPDTTAISPATVESYFLFSMEQWKPVVAFSSVYLPKGAAAVLDIDRVAMGRQSGEIANRLLQGASPDEIPFQEPIGVVTRHNQVMSKKLGVNVGE